MNTNDTLIEKPEAMSVNNYQDVESDRGLKKQPTHRCQWRQWLAAISATLSMVAVGTVYGWTTVLLPRLIKTHVDVPMTITNDEGGWVASLNTITTLIGSFLAAFLSKIFGRKWCLLSSSIFYISGWLMIFFGTTVVELYIARLILGFGVGISYATNPTYISEVADTNIRCALGTLIAINVFTGSLITCSIGPYVSYNTLTVVMLMIPILFAITFIWFPESPYFLVMNNRHEAAAKSIAFFKNIDIAEARMKELPIVISNIAAEPGNSDNWRTQLRRLCALDNRKAFMMVFVLILTQQLSGNYPMMQYLTTILESAKIGLDPNVGTIINMAFALVFGTFATMTVERVGRRPLLMVSTAGCAVTLLLMSIYFFLQTQKIDLTAVNFLPVIVLVFFQLAYQIGLGTLANALIGELFPVDTKDVAASSITIADGILSFISSKFFDTLVGEIAYEGVYLIYAVSCFLAFFFVFFCIPETKNKSFAAIREELLKRSFQYRGCF